MEFVELLGILKDGESTTIEFKETLNKELKKSVCAFANTKGGRIFIGIKDDGTPVGVKNEQYKQEISDELQSLRPLPNFTIESIPITTTKIIVVSVQESSVLISSSNVAYVRAGTNNYPLSLDEVIEKSSESLRVFFDQITSDVPITELNKELLHNYLEQRKKTRGIEYDNQIVDAALKLKIVRRKNEGIFLTNAGILCFTDDPQKYIGNSSVRLIKFNDDEMKTYSFQEEFVGPLPKIVEQLEKYFLKNLNRVGGFTIGFKRQEFLEYPLMSLREALINAIIHRNYFDAADIRIFVFPNRIEIRNPGSFPPGVSIESPEHKPRNPQLAQYFYDLGFSEKYGSGIKKIIKETSGHPFVGVEFAVKPYNTMVCFRKNLSKVNLDSTNQKILEFLANEPKGSGEIAKVIGLSRQSIVDRLRSLTLLGFIKQEGEGPKTVYAFSKLLV